MLSSRKFLLQTTVLLAFAFLMGCAMVTPGPAPVTGFIYTGTKAPGFATSNAIYSKSGYGECISILGWVAYGDCSIDAILKNSGITQVHHVDYHTRSVLGVYAQLRVMVYGD